MATLPMLSDFPPRRIEVSILVYPGFELLDATGPASVFNTANFILGQRATGTRLRHHDRVSNRRHSPQ